MYILTKSVGVEAIGCEQLAQSRYAAAPGRESNSRPFDRKSDALPLRHRATLQNSQRMPKLNRDLHGIVAYRSTFL